MEMMTVPETRATDYASADPSSPNEMVTSQRESSIVVPGPSTVNEAVKAVSPLYRLLYRGALSLPDTYLLLDGLTFTARIGDPHQTSGSNETNLLENPLALALESMRGRPSLQFKGVTKLKDVWLDATGDISMDIHSYSILSRVYFENILCLLPITSLDGKSDMGVRIALGDSDGPGTTEILVYGQLSPENQPSSSRTLPVQIRVARIIPSPRSISQRPPRPDDPTPRIPLLIMGSKRTLELSDALEGSQNKRVKSSADAKGKTKSKAKDAAEDEALRKARDVMLHLPKPGQSSRSKGSGKKDDTLFKVPALPSRLKQGTGTKSTRTGKIKMDLSDIHDMDAGVASDASRSHGKDQEGSEDPIQQYDKYETEMESANKVVIKKIAVKHLSAAGVDKGHHEFKDLFAYVYRGTLFALRNKVKLSHISRKTIDKTVEGHVLLYLPHDVERDGKAYRIIDRSS